MRLMLVPIARRVAPSTSNQNGSKYLVAIADASELLSIDGCASGVETGVGICFVIAVLLLLSAKLIAMPFPTSIAAQNRPVAIIIDVTALEDNLNIGDVLSRVQLIVECRNWRDCC